MSFLRKTVWLLGLALAGIPAHAADPLPLTAFIVDLDQASKNSMRAMPGLQQTGLAFTAMLDTAVNGDIEMTRQAAEAAGYRVRSITRRGATIWCFSVCCNPSAPQLCSPRRRSVA